ncbi:unnamed protein product [Symbiodinium sp. CCMP2592]|nr:unnamed protein product [Symbiodinium sp. CCMP2592]
MLPKIEAMVADGASDEQLALNFMFGGNQLVQRQVVVEGKAMAKLLCVVDIRMALSGAWIYETVSKVLLVADCCCLVLQACLRTLAALADAHDEHMLIVRLADEENVDGVMLQEELFRNLLEKQPLHVQKEDGRMRNMGGPEQCNGMVLREVLARMHNWVELVKDVIKAELPHFEAFASISSLLQLSNPSEKDDDSSFTTTSRDLKKPAETMSALLNVSPVA